MKSLEVHGLRSSGRALLQGRMEMAPEAGAGPCGEFPVASEHSATAARCHRGACQSSRRPSVHRPC